MSTPDNDVNLAISGLLISQQRIVRETPQRIKLMSKPEGFEYIYVPLKNTAKLIREDLKRYYPLTKFSVRTQRMSGGTSAINVQWQSDGPEMDEVDAFLDRYSGSVSDESGDFRDNVAVLIDGRWYHFEATFISCERHTMVIEA